MDNVKKCSKCRQEKPLADFAKRSARSKRGAGVQPACRVCVRKQKREIYAKNPHPNKAAHYKQRYGLSYEQCIDKLNTQGGDCAICKTPLSETHASGRVKFNVDHCHTTGNVRGILCTRCNHTLGLLETSTVPVDAYLNYIQKHKQQGDVIGTQSL